MNTSIKNVLEGYFENVYSVIAEKYNIPVSDLENIFESLFESEPKKEVKKKDEDVKQSCTCVYVFERSGKNNKKGDVCGVKIKGEGDLCSKHNKNKKTPVDKKKEEKNDEDIKQSCTCVYVFERSGKNNKKGDVCGVKIKGEGDLCSKHKDKKKSSVKEEKKKPEKKTKIPKPRVPSKKNTQKEEIIEDEIIEKEIKEAKPKVILKKHKNLGVFYHAETRFVFESPLERTIIGKLTDEDLIDPITDSDEALVKKYKFIVA